MTHTKFKGPGQWRSQAAEIEDGVDTDDTPGVDSEDEHESARPGTRQGGSEEAE